MSPTPRGSRNNALRYIPAGFVILRFVLGPLLWWDAHLGMPSPWFIIGFVTAGLTDLFDGIIARRLDSVTVELREWDGRVDVWFYFWIALSVWSTHADILQTYTIPLLFVLGLQMLAWLIDLIKFRRFSNYHAYSAKALGFALFGATLALFAFNEVGILLWLAIGAGTICMLEEIAITLTLPQWMYDVPSILHARRLRTELLNERTGVSEL